MVTNGSQTAGTADGPEGIQWAAQERGLSEQTLDALPVRFGTVFFPELERKTRAIFFKYSNGWKARSLEEKAFVSSKGFKIEFWGQPEVISGPHETIYITEGELDKAALIEAGIPDDAVLSVPNGSARDTGEPSENPYEVKGYAYVLDALKAGLNRKRCFVWCGDSDPAGLALRSDMAHLFGAAKFRFLDWPKDIKDANDCLLAEGPAYLYEFVTKESKPWPVRGLYRIKELPEPPPLITWHPGFAEWEDKIALAPRTLSVVTGHPGMGKSILFNQIWYQVVEKYGLTMCQATFETRAKPHVRRQLRTLINGKLEKELTEDQIAKADDWINDHYWFIEHPDQRPKLEWILDMAEVAVIRHGARILQIDPWNRLEGSRPRDQNETDYIGDCLKACYAFANDLNCHVQIVGHPAKVDSKRRGEPPMLEDMAGSKNWDNMPDQGFVVHRPKIFDGVQRKTEAVLFHRKARFSELGYACMMSLNYELQTGRYRSVDYDVY